MLNLWIFKLKNFYEFGGDYERHIEDGIYMKYAQELLKRGFDPQEGLFIWIY